LTGIAQRRDRAGAWFFTMALVRPEQHRLASLLAVHEDERCAIGASLQAETDVIGSRIEDVEGALGCALGGVWSAGEDVPAEPHPAEGDRDLARGHGHEPVDGVADPGKSAVCRPGGDLEQGRTSHEGEPGRDR
jgi:hypothetical protein